MSDSRDWASDTDLAAQSATVTDDADDPDADELEPFSAAGADAADADLIEQHQRVPSGEDDYTR